MAVPLAPWGLVLSRLDRVVFDPDITPPSVPVLAAAVVFDQTRIDLAWSTSVDLPPNPSGLAGYDVQTDGSTVTSVGIQTAMSATGFSAGSTHTFRVRSRDLAGNVSGYSNQVSATTTAAQTVFNPTYPRLASYLLGGLQNYAASTVTTALAKRHFNILTHYAGWQNGQGGGVSMAQVCQNVKAQSAISTRMYVYINYSEISKTSGTAPNASFEPWQYISTNTQFAYQNGLTFTNPVDSQFGPTFYKLNYTTAGLLVAGKTLAQWYLDWTKGLNYTGATISTGTVNRTAANNAFWDGTFFDNVFNQERVSADFDRNGSVDVVTAAASQNLIRASHAAAADYFRTILPGQEVLANSTDWRDLGSGFATTVLNQKFDGGLLEGGIGSPFGSERNQSFQNYMDGNAVQMAGYRGAKMGVCACAVASLTDYRVMRYAFAATAMTNAYFYLYLGTKYLSEDLPNLWYDEFDFNLGAPIDAEQIAPRFAGGGNAANGEGYWVRDFVNGKVIVTARRGNTALANFDQETPYTAYALGGTFYRLAGTQDPTTNNGAAVTSVQMKPRDGLVLRRTPAESIPPSVPSSLSAVAATAQINLTWNVSADTGGSGLAGYKIERSTSSGSGFAQINTSVSASYVDSTAVGGTQYFYRVRAYDFAGNNSGYSNVATATIVVQQAPVWATVPAVTFTQGVAGNFSLSPYVSDPNSDPLTLTKNAIALPSGVTFDGPNKRYVYDGSGSPAVTSGHIVTASDSGTTSADVDFAARAAAAGILRAIRVTSLADVQANTLQDATHDHVVFEPNFKRSGVGSARFNILNTDTLASGLMQFYISPTQQLFGNGSEYYVQWSQYLPVAFCFGLFPGTPGIGDNVHSNGFKQMICSHHSGTAMNNEVVMENTFQMGCPLAYHQDGNSFAQFSVAQSSACNSADFRFQNAIDNGGTVTNCPTAYAKWGPMYSMPAYTGTPHAQNGGFKYTPDTWMTFMIRVKIGTLGNASSTVEMWGAVSGQAPTKIHSYIGNVQLGLANGGHDTFWPLPYQTAKTPGVGYDTFTCYDEFLTGTLPIPFPGGFTVTPS